MAYYDEYDNPYDPYDRGVIKKLPRDPDTSPVAGPYDPGPIIPVTDTAATTPPPDNRPPKPTDPGDGRVYIWNGTQWVLTEPANAPYPSSGQGRGTDGFDFTSSFNDWPIYNAPDYLQPSYITTPDFDPGPAFTYADFTAPDPNQINNDPAYQFRFNQGIKALGANRAGRGTFLSGETGQALQDFGQKAASQEYDNIFNRALTSYDTNRGNAFQNWAAQYGQRKDKYGFTAAENAAHNQFNLSDTNAHNQFNLSNAQSSFGGAQTQALAKFQDLFNRYKAQGDWLSALAGDNG